MKQAVLMYTDRGEVYTMVVDGLDDGEKITHVELTEVPDDFLDDHPCIVQAGGN